LQIIPVKNGQHIFLTWWLLSQARAFRWYRKYFSVWGEITAILFVQINHIYKNRVKYIWSEEKQLLISVVNTEYKVSMPTVKSQ